jgi:hypothetical protein
MARGSFLGPPVDEHHPYANKRARIAIVRSRRGQWHEFVRPAVSQVCADLGAAFFHAARA